MKMGKIQETILLLMLALAAQEDVRTGKISMGPPAVGAVLCIAFQIAAGEFRPADAALGAGVGLMLLLIGYASRQAVGYGDGLMFTATGCCLGSVDNVVLLLCSLLMCSAYSIVMLVSRRKKRNDRIVFVPFVLGGFVLLTGVYW